MMSTWVPMRWCPRGGQGNRRAVRLQAVHSFATYRPAVWWTMQICAIIALLLALTQAAYSPGQSHVEWLREVGAVLHATITSSA